VMTVSVCLYVCDHISGTTSAIFGNFFGMLPMSMAQPLLAVLLYVMYLWFYGRRHVCTLWPGMCSAIVTKSGVALIFLSLMIIL